MRRQWLYKQAMFYICKISQDWMQRNLLAKHSKSLDIAMKKHSRILWCFVASHPQYCLFPFPDVSKNLHLATSTKALNQLLKWSKVIHHRMKFRLIERTIISKLVICQAFYEKIISICRIKSMKTLVNFHHEAFNTRLWAKGNCPSLHCCILVRRATIYRSAWYRWLSAWL